MSDVSGVPFEAGLELVMPFVAVASTGGPYDDESYSAGWEAGTVDAELRALPLSVDQATYTLRADHLAQFDLIAMRHGWTVDVVEIEDCPDWKIVTFDRAEDD